MPASYPSDIKNFSTKVDFVNVIYAENVNSLQTEVTAIETTLGKDLLVSSGWSGSLDTTTSTWTNLKDRINNIEYGVGTAINNRVSTAGGSTITPAATTTVSLKFIPISSQTVDQAQFYNQSSAVITKVDKDGKLYVNGVQVVPVPAGGTVDQALLKSSSTDFDYTWKDVATVNPLLLAGM